MNARAFLPHGPYVGALTALAVLLVMARCEAIGNAEQWGVDKTLLKAAEANVAQLRRDSATIAARVIRLRADSAASAARIRRLRADSAVLVAQSAQLKAQFATELSRWQTMVAGAADSTRSLADFIRQANVTLESCQLDTAKCEELRLNAEKRAAEADTARQNAEKRRAAADSLWRLAELKATERQEQADIWKRRAKPSLLDQLKQIPGRALASSTLIATGYFACKVGG